MVTSGVKQAGSLIDRRKSHSRLSLSPAYQMVDSDGVKAVDSGPLIPPSRVGIDEDLERPGKDPRTRRHTCLPPSGQPGPSSNECVQVEEAHLVTPKDTDKGQRYSRFDGWST